MKTKVLFFLTSLKYGGTEKTTISYLNELSQSNKYEITLCVMFDVNCVETLEKSIHESVKIIYLTSSEVGDLFHKVQTSYAKGYIYKIKYVLFRLKYNIILEKKFDEIISQNQPTTLVQADSVMPDYFFKYKNLTKIIFVHFSLDHLFSGLLKSYRIDRWAKKLKQYDFILAISKRGYSQLKPFCNTDQLRLIYNPTFEKEIIPLSLQEYQLPDGVINGEYIISVGRLDENQKDFTSLIKAIKIANANYNQSYKLLIVGAGRDKEYLEKLVIDNSLQKFVFFIGNQRNPYPYIANSSLLVLSTKFEGFGNVLLEAIILGKLAISSDCLTGPSEILNHEKLLVPVGNSRLLAEAIHVLLSTKQLRDDIYIHLGKQKQLFDPKHSVEALEELLN